MSEPIYHCIQTAPLSLAQDAWRLDEIHGCWCLEEVLYTQKPTVPEVQRLSIYVPAAYFSAPGVLDTQAAVNGWTAATAPVVLANHAADYLQATPLGLDNPQCNGTELLTQGFVYVTCGSRGRDSKDSHGVPCGKSPATLVDLKMAVRFLRHFQSSLPGNLEKIISLGTGVGGGMSALLCVTGNSPLYQEELDAAGAFLEERDDVFAGQMYCPITNLEHADSAYEWMFQADKASPSGSATPFEAALSQQLSAAFVRYFNDLKLPHPLTGLPLVIEADGRSGTGYDFMMYLLNFSASRWLTNLGRGKLSHRYSIQDYLSGHYTQAGTSHGKSASPAGGASGTDKRDWLSWRAGLATISHLDTYVLRHRRRQRPCPAFDQPDCASGENLVLGTAQAPGCHFSEEVFRSICLLKEQFPGEYEALSAPWAQDLVNQDLQRRAYLYNPMHFIGTQEVCDQAKFYRIRVGACDGNTPFVLSAILSLALEKAGKQVNCELVWDQPHGAADYPGELALWIASICR